MSNCILICRLLETALSSSRPTAQMLLVTTALVACAISAGSARMNVAVDVPSVLLTVNDVTITTDVAVDRSKDRVYVTEGSFFPEQRVVAIVEGATHHVVNRIAVPNAWALALNSANNKLYVGDRPALSGMMFATVTVIDTATSAVVATISGLRGEVLDIAVNDKTNRVYVSHGGVATVIDGATNAVIGTITGMPRAPHAVAVNTTTNRLYFSNMSGLVGSTDNGVTVVDGATHEVIAYVQVQMGPIAVAVNPLTNDIYTADYWSGTVSVIDGASNIVVATLSVGANPRDIDINLQTNTIYVAVMAQQLNAGVAVIDGTTKSVTGFAKMCGNRFNSGIRVNDLTNRIYVAAGGGFGLLVLSNELGDIEPPFVSNPVFSVNPKTVDELTVFHADAGDAITQVAGGEYFIGTDPGVGHGVPFPVWVPTSSFSDTIGPSLEPGVYTVGVRGQDEACNWSSAAAGFLVVYDPNGSFATGAGAIIPGGASSDAADALPGINGTSKAEFAFTVKYQSGVSTVPGGHLQFRYRAGDFNLQSTAMDWMVVTNTNWVRFQGTAVINGSAETVRFRVEARDGSALGHADRFIIKVFSASADPDTASPAYKASGDVEHGQIVIHR